MQPDLTYKPVPESTAVIKKIHELTAHYWLKTKLGNGLLVVGEFACYFLTICLVVLAIMMPNGTITYTEEVSPNITVDTNVKVKEVIYFFTALKLVIGILGLLILIPAVLFRKVRKKNNVQEEVNTICGEYLGKVS